MGESVGQKTFPAGTWVVEAAQPRNRFIRAMLGPKTPPLPPEEMVSDVLKILRIPTNIRSRAPSQPEIVPFSACCRAP